MTTLVDFISDSYYDSKAFSWLISNGIYHTTDYPYPWGFAQSFKGNGLALDSCKFYLKRKETQTGYICAKLYAYGALDDPPNYNGGGLPFGTLDENGRPTPLATSDYVDVTTVGSSSFSWITFTFSGVNRYVLTDATTDDHFFIALEYVGSSTNNLGRGVFAGIYETKTSVSSVGLGGAVIVDTLDVFQYYTSRLATQLLMYKVYSESGSDPATSKPVLSIPVGGSTYTTNYQPGFDWNSVVDAVKYHIQIDRLGTFLSNYEDRTTINSDFTLLGNLKGYNGIYYWRVAAANSESTWSDWSDVSTFTIAVPPTDIFGFPVSSIRFIINGITIINKIVYQ